MPTLNYGLSSYERDEGDLPGLPVINMYAEETGSEGIVLQSRKGLSDRSADMGSGPVEALFQLDRVVSGALLGVSDGKLYNATSNVGTVTGTGIPSIAGNETGVLVCAGDDLHSYDGTTFATVAVPDSFNVIKVIEAASRFIVLREDTGRYYFTPALAQTFDALDFATAETNADAVLDALFINDILYLFGSETVELHPNTNDNNLPFQALEASVMERGIWATGCATEFSSGFAWITDIGTVCERDESNIISNQGIEERINASTDVRLWRFYLDGTEFLALRIDNETQVFNARTRLWSEFKSHGEDNWLPQCYANGVFGSAKDGKTLQWGSDHQDLGGELERRFRAGTPINGGGLNIANVRLRLNPGQTPNLTGDFAEPTVELRTSRDAGETFGNWRSVSLGAQGKYRTKVEWRALGMASQPGFLGEFRVTDPVPFRVSGAFYNEAWGGR